MGTIWGGAAQVKEHENGQIEISLYGLPAAIVHRLTGATLMQFSSVTDPRDSRGGECHFATRLPAPSVPYTGFISERERHALMITLDLLWSEPASDETGNALSRLREVLGLPGMEYDSATGFITEKKP